LVSKFFIRMCVRANEFAPPTIKRMYLDAQQLVNANGPEKISERSAGMVRSTLIAEREDRP